jgi:hypothetical protein
MALITANVIAKARFIANLAKATLVIIWRSIPPWGVNRV